MEVPLDGLRDVHPAWVEVPEVEDDHIVGLGLTEASGYLVEERQRGVPATDGEVDAQFLAHLSERTLQRLLLDGDDDLGRLERPSGEVVLARPLDRVLKVRPEPPVGVVLTPALVVLLQPAGPVLEGVVRYLAPLPPERQRRDEVLVAPK